MIAARGKIVVSGKWLVQFLSLITLHSSLVLAMLLVSCASVKRDMRYPVHVTNTCVVDLLAPADISSPVDALFSLTMAAGENAFSAIAYLTADSTGVYASLMNDFGMDMASISYDGESLTLDSDVLSKNLPPQYIVADLQFALYREDAVRAALEDAGLTFKAEGTKRAILKGKKIIEEIESDGSNITVHNLLRDYVLEAHEASE